MLLTVTSLLHRKDGLTLCVPDWQIAARSRWRVDAPDPRLYPLLLACLTGFATPEQGRICWLGDNIGSLAEPDRSERRSEIMAPVPKSLQLFANLSVAENLQLARRLSGRLPSDQAVNAAMRSMEIDAESQSLASSLPPLQARKAALARAIACDAKLVLCDQLDTGLDSADAQRLYDLLLHACTTHQLALVWFSRTERAGLEQHITLGNAQ